MTKEEREEVMYVLESRLIKYTETAKHWLNTTGYKIKGKTFTDRISGDIPLYFRSNAKPWQSIVPNISPFCFCFTKDLGISNMLESSMRITDVLETLSEEGLVINGMRIVAKSNTHLMGTSQQVLIMYPQEQHADTTMSAVNIVLTMNEALQLLSNETIDKHIRSKITRQMQGKKEYEI